MFDHHLSELYETSPKKLNQAVKRNFERFPQDFMFQLSKDEYDRFLRSQFVTLGSGQHKKYLPYVFTEQGVAMLSSVLNSKRAVQVNIQIIRTFTKLREMLETNKDLKNKINDLEKRYDSQFKTVFEAIRLLLNTDKKKPAEEQMGFRIK